MDLVLAMSPTAKCMVVLLFTGVAAPLAGILFRHVGGGWNSLGKGPLAIEQRLPPVALHLASPQPLVDPAIQAAEVRQMLEAKVSRLERRGEPPIDVEAETERLLAPTGEAPSTGERQNMQLRAEVRQLVVSRNERRMHKGLEPLDVEAETERQLADFIGSP
ncbi:MAG TPA: hypothetical protein VFR04_01105 [Solirubrobacterales bacterium]|nr:hypothetical protein [Solirubrobacterales bacterium]